MSKGVPPQNDGHSIGSSTNSTSSAGYTVTMVSSGMITVTNGFSGVNLPVQAVG